MKKEWFEKKAVLDIGCNAGFLTLTIAKVSYEREREGGISGRQADSINLKLEELEPRRVLGIDIDPHLVGVARKNIRHYCDQQTPVS